MSRSRSQAMLEVIGCPNSMTSYPLSISSTHLSSSCNTVAAGVVALGLEVGDATRRALAEAENIQRFAGYPIGQRVDSMPSLGLA